MLLLLMTKQEKIYNPTNISALARYLHVTTHTIHNWKRGETVVKKGEPPKQHPYTKKKFDLIMKGWKVECSEQTK